MSSLAAGHMQVGQAHTPITQIQCPLWQGDVHFAASDAQLKYHHIPLHEVGATPLHDARGR